MTVRSVAVRDQVEPKESAILNQDETKLTRREAMALRLARSLADHPFNLTDELMTEAQSEFTDAEIVEIVFACAMFSWGNILGIAFHIDTNPDSPYGSGLDYDAAKRRKTESLAPDE